MMRTSTNLPSLQLTVALVAGSLACGDNQRENTDDEVGSPSTIGGEDTKGDGVETSSTFGESANADIDTTTETTDETTTDEGETTTDSTTETGGAEPVPCEVAAAALTPVVPQVMLVLDKSGSMIQNTWDHDADAMTPEVTRWKSLHAVVSEIVNGFDEEFKFGDQLYPAKTATNEYNMNACVVQTPPEVLVADNNAVPILLAIPTANSQNIRGGTPSSSGMSSAIDHLIDVDDGNPMAIILITDGAANCRTDAANDFQRFESYDIHLPTIVGDAYTDLDIATYVVGVDISDVMTQVTGVNNHPPDGEPDGISPFEKLNEVAVAGGKPLGGIADFYQADNELELEAALKAIITDATSCTVLLNPVPKFPDLIEVEVDEQPVPHVMDCANEDGWVYTDPNDPEPDSIELCGDWCEASQDAMFVTANYFCDPG